MNVEIIKMHKKYDSQFKVGDIVPFDGKNISTIRDSLMYKAGTKFDLHELCKAFSNRCSYSEIIKKQ